MEVESRRMGMGMGTEFPQDGKRGPKFVTETLFGLKVIVYDGDGDGFGGGFDEGGWVDLEGLFWPMGSWKKGADFI